MTPQVAEPASCVSLMSNPTKISRQDVKCPLVTRADRTVSKPARLDI